MLDKSPAVFVDIETSGLNCYHGRVIEVGVLRVEQAEVIDTFHSLINPETYLPPEVTLLTGIGSRELALAPNFYEVGEELAKILAGATFVAHNVRFDYSFLKQEFRRLGKEFAPKLLCTARLSRALFPEEARHGLDKIIERHGLKVANRHRAFDDAEALWQFSNVVRQRFTSDTINEAVKRQFRRQALPTWIDDSVINALPKGPGVYIFEGEDATTLYVGKSVQVRTRVLSHFSSDHAHPRELRIAQRTRRIRAIPTHGELSALLLESRLVKSLQPLHNRRLRQPNELVALKRRLTPQGYETITIDRHGLADSDDFRDVMAVYRTYGQARKALRTVAKEYRLCEKLLGLEKSPSGCFPYQLKRCNGACLNKELPVAYNLRVAEAFAKSRLKAWPYHGQVAVTEQSEGLGAKSLILDNWKVVAEVADDTEMPEAGVGASFDVDTYRILRQYLANPVNARRVKVLDRAPAV